MINLAIDIGNSRVKAAIFDGGRPVELLREDEIEACLPRVEAAIVVSTRSVSTDIEALVRAKMGRFVRFDHTTPVPIKNLYGTPETLGCDRLAAAVGACVVRPDRNVLTVDFGTAITCDLVTAAGEFLGGNISPGAGSRFRALHEYTGALPLCGLPDVCGESGAVNPSPELRMPEFPASNTKDAIECGVVAGIIAETEHYIAEARKKMGEIDVIFTGGDADYFARRVNFPIFAVPDLVFRGLNAILEHNATI